MRWVWGALWLGLLSGGLGAWLGACGAGHAEGAHASGEPSRPARAELEPLALGPLRLFLGDRAGPTLDWEGHLVAGDGTPLGTLFPRGVLEGAAGDEIGRLAPNGQVMVDGRRTPQRVDNAGTLSRDGSTRLITLDDEGRLAGLTVPSELRIEGAEGPLRRTAMFLYAVLFFPRAHGVLASEAFAEPPPASEAGGPE